MTDTVQEQLTQLGLRWVQAELDADSDTLDRLSTDDFTLVGPLGCVLDKQQWLDRYAKGDLRTTSLQWEPAKIRGYDDVGVAVGRLTQQATHRGTPSNGSFRVTQIAVGTGEGLRLAGLHYSPIAG